MLITWRYVMLEPEVLASPADRAALASLAAAAAAGLVPAIVAGWVLCSWDSSDAIVVITRQL